ncbi:MAG TPA: glycoside hydrolase family 2 protein [Candidatus Acidoferrales bacterium]|nr:glycoside hydrolase family 2 protein [Candidatus Acidoferrales bacterium]
MRRFLLAFTCAAAVLPAAPESKLLLRQGWAIQSSAEVRETGAALSAPGFRPRGWTETTVPTTVFSALSAAKKYPDPYFGMNLRSAPGVAYNIGVNFSNLPMPADSPFRKPWWFRTEFKLPVDYRGKTVWLGFDGLNFRANVWLNGKQVAASDKLAGAWRLFALDVTAAAKAGDANALALEIFPPEPGDLAITFVDWNPLPPDKLMGLFRDVWIAATGPVAIRYPSVTTHLAGDAAELSVRAELTNATAAIVEGVLKGKIENREFAQPVRLAAHETKVVHAAQTVTNPRLWWPVIAGPQNLYPLDLKFEIGGKTSDSTHIDFGIREVTSELDNGHRLFRINGKNILIRGAGYTFDLLMRSTPERQEAELRYVKDMNLNAVRFEGKLEDEHFLELCDRMGILVLAGWCCCDHWEKWKDWDKEDEVIAAESLRDQLRRLARHPSVFDWLYGSDNPPPPKIEQIYLNVIKEVEWPNPYQSSATAKRTPEGDTGVKMNGPYEYVAPSYWLLDTKAGGAYGFNTETSPGPAPPPIESLRRMLPADNLWPINAAWNYHAGGGEFRTIRVFTEALNQRYGESRSAEEYARKAQVMAYEGHRAMFEAFGRNKYTATGVIQWMLNNAWPGMIWHLYDWYLRPGGSYFGAKKACEPLHVQYSYDDRSIVVVNSYYREFANMKVVAEAYNLDMSLKFSRDAKLDAPPDSATRVFTLPEIAEASPVWFLNLKLEDPSDDVVSENFYWFSTKPETLEWEKGTWYHTPTKTFADYTALQTLPRVSLKVESKSKPGSTTVTLTNPAKTLAFAVRLKLARGADGEEVLPVLWEDNYFALLPGQTRQVTATYASKDLGAAKPVVTAEPW